MIILWLVLEALFGYAAVIHYMVERPVWYAALEGKINV